MGLVTKSCLCCNEANCCSVKDPYSVTFFTDYPYREDFRTIHDLSGPNGSSCIGKSELEIQVWRDAPNPKVCNGFCGPTCNTGGVDPGFAGNVFAQIGGFLGAYTYGAAAASRVNALWGASGGTPPDPYTNSCCFDLFISSAHAKVARNCSCDGEPVWLSSDSLFTAYFPTNNQYTGNPHVWSLDNLWKPAIESIDAFFSSHPFYYTTVRNGYVCTYVMFGLDVVRNMDTGSTVCISYLDGHHTICHHSVDWIQLRCGVMCTLDPCHGSSPYSWPLTLTAINDSPYKKQSLTGSTECKYYLYSTEGETYDGTKCTQRATYRGIISSGGVNCVSTPLNTDCQCCE
jgi:hypothetical protein